MRRATGRVSVTITVIATMLAFSESASAQLDPPSTPSWNWPLYERAAGAITSTPRPSVFNTMGQYEYFSGGPSPHPGTDFVGNAGDLSMFPAAGEIVYVSNPGHYTAPDRYCRVWVQASSTSVLYYVGHLVEEAALPTDPQTLAVRDAIDSANHAGVGNVLPNPIPVAQGDIAGGLAYWNATSPMHHVHLGAFDSSDQFSSIDPLPFIMRTASGDTGDALTILDDEAPTIASFELQPRDSGSSVDDDGLCGTEVRGTIDVVLDATDTFYTTAPAPNPFDGQGVLHPETDIYGASYTVQRVDETQGTTRQWYESPVGCVDTACGLWRLRYEEARSVETLEEWFFMLQTGSPSGPGRDVADYLWDTVNSTPMAYQVPLTDPVHYYHYLSNGVREGDTTVTQPGWNTSELSDGRYVVTARTWDQAGNATSLSTVVTVNNGGLTEPPSDPQGWASIYVADRDEDVGQTPSNPGGEPYWASPDIIVEPQGSGTSCASKVARTLPLVVGQNYDVWVRVHNNGCTTVDAIGAVVYSAVPSAPLTGINPIGSESYSEYTVSVGAGDVDCIGPFAWSPTEEELDSEGSGHRCLVAAVSAVGDEGPDPAGEPVESWSVADDNNIAQRNAQMDLLSFIVRNPTDATHTAQLQIQMPAGFPDAAVFELLVEDPDGGLGTVWATTPNVTVVAPETIEGVTYAVVQIDGQAPVLEWSLPAISQRIVRARAHDLPMGSLYAVDVDFDLLDTIHDGGMIFYVRGSSVPE